MRKASDLAMAAGADFIKTSTGKVVPAATPPVVLVMLEAIRDHFLETGRRIGHEAGRRHPHVEAGAPLPRPRQGDARRRLADAGPLPLRRLDAVNDVLMQLDKEASGRYQSADYFTKD